MLVLGGAWACVHAWLSGAYVKHTTSTQVNEGCQWRRRNNWTTNKDPRGPHSGYFSDVANINVYTRLTAREWGLKSTPKRSRTTSTKSGIQTFTCFISYSQKLQQPTLLKLTLHKHLSCYPVTVPSGLNNGRGWATQRGRQSPTSQSKDGPKKIKIKNLILI